MLVDTLIKIKKLKKPEQSKLALVLLRTDKIFAKYIKLCYDDAHNPRPCFHDLNITYRESESPLGMDFGSLESAYGKFATCVFNIGYDAMSDETANIRLVQIFEILNINEVEFLKEIIKCKYSGLSKSEYEAVKLP